VKRGAVTVGFLHPGEVAGCFMHSLTDLLFYDAANNQRIVSHRFGQLAKEAHAGRIHSSRNELAKNLLDDSEAEWLFVVDADMGFAPDTVDRLIASADKRHRPVVGGLCFGLKTERRADFFAQRYRIVPTLYHMAETAEKVGFIPMLDYPKDQLVEVDATGAACLLIHRSVLHEIRDQHGDKWFSLIDVPKGEGGFTEFSEDISFCLRSHAVGRKVWVDTSIKTTHAKGGIYLDEEMYDLQQWVRSALPVEADKL